MTIAQTRNCLWDIIDAQDAQGLTHSLDFLFTNPTAGPEEGGFDWTGTRFPSAYWVGVLENSEDVELLKEYASHNIKGYLSKKYQAREIRLKFRSLRKETKEADE